MHVANLQLEGLLMAVASINQVLADRGETVVLEPTAMRRAVAARAQALPSELGLSPRRKRTVEPA